VAVPLAVYKIWTTCNASTGRIIITDGAESGAYMVDGDGGGLVSVWPSAWRAHAVTTNNATATPRMAVRAMAVAGASSWKGGGKVTIGGSGAALGSKGIAHKSAAGATWLRSQLALHNFSRGCGGTARSQSGTVL